MRTPTPPHRRRRPDRSSGGHGVRPFTGNTRRQLSQTAERAGQEDDRHSRNSIRWDRSRVIKQFRCADQLERELVCYEATKDLGIAPRLRDVDRKRLMINLDRCGTPVRGRPKSALPRDLARRAFEILASFHAVGFAHRDFHAGNLLVDAAGNVRIVDFEWAYDYGPSAPPLELTYDLTGRGLPSPSHTHHMHWDRRHRASLRAVTNVSAAEAYDQYVADLRKELTAVSGYKLGKRFDRGGLVYQTFHHPRFELKKGQRNVAARFLAMRVGNLKGKTVLDLGANLGSVSIQACLHGARQVTAVEADASRVQVARKIAAVTGLHRKIEFVTNDVNDYLRKAHGHDVVLCLALDAWVDDPQLLYRRAAATTKRILYLETNRLRRRSEVEPIFRNLGFRTVKYLGTTESEDAFGTRRLLFHIERRP